MIKLFEANNEYLTLIARRDKVKAELQNAYEMHGRLEMLKMSVGNAFYRYEKAREKFSKICVEKVIFERNSNKDGSKDKKTYRIAKEELLRAYDEYEIIKAKIEIVSDLYTKYQEVEKSIIDFYNCHKEELIAEKERLENELTAISLECDKKYGHVFKDYYYPGIGHICKCVLCGKNGGGVGKGYFLDCRYVTGFDVDKENLGKIITKKVDKWPKELAESYSDVENIKNEIKEIKCSLRKICETKGHEYKIKDKAVCVCILCGKEEPYW